MARQTKGPLRIDLSPIVETMGMAWVVKQLSLKQVIDAVGVKQLWNELTPAQRQELKRLAKE